MCMNRVVCEEQHLTTQRYAIRSDQAHDIRVCKGWVCNSVDVSDDVCREGGGSSLCEKRRGLTLCEVVFGSVRYTILGKRRKSPNIEIELERYLTGREHRYI